MRARTVVVMPLLQGLNQSLWMINGLEVDVNRASKAALSVFGGL